MEDPDPVENIDRLGVLMFQTSDNSQLLRRVLWISKELTIVSSLKHKNTQPIYIFNRVRVLHLERLKEGTWFHSFAFSLWFWKLCASMWPMNIKISHGSSGWLNGRVHRRQVFFCFVLKSQIFQIVFLRTWRRFVFKSWGDKY